MYIDQGEINMIKSLEKSISKADIEGASSCFYPPCRHKS